MFVKVHIYLRRIIMQRPNKFYEGSREMHAGLAKTYGELQKSPHFSFKERTTALNFCNTFLFSEMAN